MGDEDINLPIYYVALTAAGYRHPPYTSPDLLLKSVTAQRLLFNQNHGNYRGETPPPAVPRPLLKQKIAGGIYNIRILYIHVRVCVLTC